jgi:hypothetical protein
LVFLLNLYFKRLPAYAFQENILYLRPKVKAPADPDSPWYDEIPVGKNTLSSIVKDMCAEGGIAKKTNHSLRATGASAMFRANVPEKIIQKTTGHRSLDALRTYEWISKDQYKTVSKVLMGNVSYENKDDQAGVCQQEKQCVAEVPHAASLSRVFDDLTNCSIGNLTVNINPTITLASKVENEFENIVGAACLDY